MLRPPWRPPELAHRLFLEAFFPLSIRGWKMIPEQGRQAGSKQRGGGGSGRLFSDYDLLASPPELRARDASHFDSFAPSPLRAAHHHHPYGMAVIAMKISDTSLSRSLSLVGRQSELGPPPPPPRLVGACCCSPLSYRFPTSVPKS